MNFENFAWLVATGALGLAGTLLRSAYEGVKKEIDELRIRVDRIEDTIEKKLDTIIQELEGNHKI